MVAKLRLDDLAKATVGDECEDVSFTNTDKLVITMLENLFDKVHILSCNQFFTSAVLLFGFLPSLKTQATGTRKCLSEELTSVRRKQMGMSVVRQLEELTHVCS